MGLGLKEKLRPSKRRRRLSISSSLVSLVPIRSEESRQDWYFAETPEEYPVGQHGLLILHTPPPEHLQQLPPLPPATEGVAYGVSRTVQFDDGLHPGDLILINHFLDEPLPEYPPSQSSRKQKFCRKLYQAKAFLQNPRADPQFPYLPRGMNNRIRQNRDPIFHKVRRLYRRLRKSFLKIIGQSTQNTPAIRPQEPVPAPYLRRLPGGYPAPERYCPQVNPTKILDPGSAFDQCGNPFGGEFQVFHETAEERKVRADRCLTERYWRRASDQRLNLEGRQQLKEPLIGKAPPLSRRQLLAPLKIKAARAKKDQRDFFKVKPLAPIPDIDPKDLPLPKENDRPSQWDRVFLANKTPPKVPAGEEIELQAFMVRVPSNSSLIEKILQDSSLQDSSPQDSSLQDPQPAYPVLAVLPASSEQPTNPPQRQTPIPKQPIAGDSDDLYNVSDREIERQRANTNLRLNQLHLEPQVDRAENRSGSVSVFSQQSHPELPNLEEDEQLRQGPREESQPLEQQVHQVQEHSAITPPIPPATFNTSKNTKASAPTDTESRKPFREPFQSDSDYTEAAPSNKYSDVPPYSNPLKPKDEDDEELRIIRGRAIATQNSAYYNERYAEERRIREGKLIAQRNTEYFAHLYHPHPHNIVTPASSQTVPSPFESASPGRRAVWNDAELALDGKKKIPPSDARSREQKERPETMDFATFLYEQTNSQVDRVPERSRRVHHRRREERPEAVGFATLPFQQTSSQANKVPERSRRVHHRRREERPETVDFATLPFQQTSSQANRVPERSNRGPGSREERPEAVGFATPQFEQTASEAQRIPEHRRRNQSREERQHALSFATLPELERHISNSHFEETELQSHPGFGTSQLEFTHLQHNQVLVSAVDRKEDFKEASKDRRAGRDIAAFDSQQHQAHTPLFPYQQSQNGYQNLRPRGRASGVFPFDPKSRRIDGTPIDPLQIDPDVWPDRSAGGFFVQEPLEKNWDQTAPLPNRCFLGHILPGRRQELNANSENHSAQEQGAENRIQNRPLDRADGTVSRTRSRFESSGPVTETATAIVENNNGDPPRQRVKQSDQDTLVSHTRTAFEIISRPATLDDSSILFNNYSIENPVYVYHSQALRVPARERNLAQALATTESVRPTLRLTTPSASTAAATVSTATVTPIRPTIRTISSTHPPAAEAKPKPSKTFFFFKGSKSFLDNCLTVRGVHLIVIAKMDNKLQVRPADFSSVKAKAVEDARQMQAKVLEECTKAGKDPPKYAILELIGKGSFGRVYKGKDMTSAAIVAVKMIDIDESDTLDPRNADSYSEFLKEVNALKILSENKARNINHVIEALPVGKAMWMITEYCGGGSIATLMKPTSPGGLQEKWIIPILREVAEAIKWVHQAGIIHRDVKCANVLITEQGSVQLCDFGVAGIVEGKLDKRSTVIGTPHWMAPELFDSTPSYGKEVDIWAFGSLVFEIATGLPPNVANGITYERLGTHLKMHVPRLEGGNYSNELRDLVAYCLEELPSARPTIEQVQKHSYIYNSSARYPASTLSSLVRAFKMWEDHGGNRQSLFMHGGAQGPSELSSTSLSDDEWNFSTTAAFDQEFFRKSSAQDVYEAYGTAVVGFSEETSRPQQSQKGSRRRPPPEALARLPAPLEKIFDPNTLSNYEDNSRSHYGRAMQQPTSDLPLRDDSAQTSIRDTMIDLGGHDSETGLSCFPDMDTIKAGRHGVDAQSEDDYVSTLPDFSRPALSDPADINSNRRTQDWKFPSMAPPSSADPELSRFPANYEIPRPIVAPGSGSRPALVHHPTEPLGTTFGGGLLGTTDSAVERMSMRESLIDLDMGLPDFSRPSTSNSETRSDTGSVTSEPSTTSEQAASMSKDPFELERHTSLYQPVPSEQSEPSIYVTEESAASSSSSRIRIGNSLNDVVDMSDFSASDAEGSRIHTKGPSEARYDAVNLSDSDSFSMPPPPLPAQPARHRAPPTTYTIDHLPRLPAPPSIAVMTGVASQDEMKKELKRMLADMTSQLEAFRDVYSSAAIAQKKGPSQQQKKDEPASQ